VSDVGQIAPADAQPHAKWPLWRIVLAYAALTAIACVSISFVDRSAMKVQNEPAPVKDVSHEWTRMKIELISFVNIRVHSWPSFPVPR